MIRPQVARRLTPTLFTKGLRSEGAAAGGGSSSLPHRFDQFVSGSATAGGGGTRNVKSTSAAAVGFSSSALARAKEQQGKGGGRRRGREHSSSHQQQQKMVLGLAGAAAATLVASNQEEGGRGGGGAAAQCLERKRNIKDFYDIVIRPIGTGGYGVVFVASHRETRERVAVKQLPKSSLSQPKVMSEVEIMRVAGEHRNIISCKDCFEDDQNYYIVMEMAEGGELFDRLCEKGAYSEHQASKTIKEIAEAMTYLHHQGIIHGDLKPENLLLATKESDADVRLVDFGSAFRGDHGQLVLRKDKGTIAYSSPEVLKGEPCSFKSDMWCLGVILYILLAGYHPFDPDNDASDETICKRALHDREKYVRFDADCWDSISADAKDLIARLLSIKADDRLSAAEILRHPWIAQDSKLSDVPLEHSAENLRRLHRGRRRLKAMMLGTMAGFANGTKKGGPGVPNDWLGSRKAAIKMIDYGNKGYVTQKDLTRILRILGEKDLTKAEITEMLRSAEGDPLGRADTMTPLQMQKLLPAICPPKILKQNEVLYNEGEVDRHYYLLRAGEAHIRSAIPRHGTSEDQLIEVLKPGDRFGELEFLVDAAGQVFPRASSCACVSERCELISVESYLFSLLNDVFESTNTKLRDEAEQRCKTIVDKWAKEVTTVSTFKTGEMAWVADKRGPDRFFMIKDGFMEAVVLVGDEQTKVVKRFGPNSYLTNMGTPGLNVHEAVQHIKCLTDCVVQEVPEKEYKDFITSPGKRAVMRFLMEMQEEKGHAQEVAPGAPFVLKKKWDWKIWNWGSSSNSSTATKTASSTKTTTTNTSTASTSASSSSSSSSSSAMQGQPQTLQ